MEKEHLSGNRGATGVQAERRQKAGNQVTGHSVSQWQVPADPNIKNLRPCIQRRPLVVRKPAQVNIRLKSRHKHPLIHKITHRRR